MPNSIDESRVDESIGNRYLTSTNFHKQNLIFLTF